MEDARFEAMADIRKESLFLPFALSLQELLNTLQAVNVDAKSGGKKQEFRMINGHPVPIGENGEPIFNNPKESGKKGEKKGKGKNKKETVEKSSESGNMEIPNDSRGKPFKRPTASNLSDKEASKVGHDINNVYHARYKGKRSGMITTYNPDDNKAYNYSFECHGFGEYNIFNKIENED